MKYLFLILFILLFVLVFVGTFLYNIFKDDIFRD